MFDVQLVGFIKMFFGNSNILLFKYVNLCLVGKNILHKLIIE